MENERIQRLLASEYGELARQAILVESPFAETTREGRGLREVALGLTPTSLLVAADVFRPNTEFRCPPDVDPSIESLELVSIYPLEFVKLSIFRRRRRRTLKARLVDGRAKYYELGGLDRRSRFWSLWCSQVRSLLERKCLGSSLSESTAAASSTCASTSYLISSGFEYDSTSGRCRKKRRRCRGGGSSQYYGAKSRNWTQKRLYLGPNYEELWDGSYKPVPIKFTSTSIEEIKDELRDLTPRKCSPKKTARSCDASQRRCPLHSVVPGDTILTRKNDRRCVDQRLLGGGARDGRGDRLRHDLLDFQPERSTSSQGDCPSVFLDLEDLDNDSFTTLSRKSSSIDKYNCKQRTPKIGGVKRIVHKLSRFGFGVNENCSFNLCYESYKKSSSCNVDPSELIENSVALWECNKTNRPKHLRRYGISTATYFLHGLGPWSVQPGDRDSVQSRRSHSCACIRRQPADPEFRLPVSRRQLTASVSLKDLSGGLTAVTRGRVVLFWTPDYWYRPRAAVDAYREVRRHLGGLKTYLIEKETRHRTRRIFGRSRGILKHVESHNLIQEYKNQEERSKGTTAYLRRLLKLEFRVTLWDLDSTTLSQQLTLIDRELFLRVLGRELEILVQQRTSREAPNFGAWVAFAHRVACLTATEILAARKLEMRARLVARLINAAEKCFRLGNFHSARSIVAGLQSPAIYRLKATWTHLKTHHATRYDTMQKLSRTFRSPRTRRYREAWLEAESKMPSIPYVGDVVARLLGLCDGLVINADSGTSRTAYGMRDKALTRRHGRERSYSAKWPAEMRDSWTVRQRHLAKIAYERWRTQVTSNRTRTKKVGHWIARCQKRARVYDFPGHSLAWEFLLKTRYREDRENFFESIQIEQFNEISMRVSSTISCRQISSQVNHMALITFNPSFHCVPICKTLSSHTVLLRF